MPDMEFSMFAIFSRHKARKAQQAEEQRRQCIIERLEATMKPNPRYAYNRAAQLPKERRERFLKNVGL